MRTFLACLALAASLVTSHADTTITATTKYGDIMGVESENGYQV